MGEKKHNSLPRLLPVYIAALVLVGLALGYDPVREYVTGTDFTFVEFMQMLILTGIVLLCRSFPLPARKGEGVDISSIAIFASFLVKGPGATSLVIIASAFFTFDKLEDGRIGHIFNTSILKTLFNNFNLIISVVLGGLVFHATGGNIGVLKLPEIILPALLYLVVSLVVDNLLMVVLFKILKDAPVIGSLVNGLRSTAPTLMALAPIGYFLGYFFTMPNSGPYLAILFFVPLMFARFSFKLYLDSKEQFFRMISTLTAAIEAKDEYTEGHSRRVEQYSVQLARAMGLPPHIIENIKVAAVLHDIGKIGIEDDILRKPSFLTDEEWGKIKMHPDIGIKILDEVAMPQSVKEMIHYHHIRYDHSGYPKTDPKLVLPMEVHIITLADAYDAMTSDRPYRTALPDEVALGIIAEERGKQFHPDVVDAFINMKKQKLAEETA